MKADFFTRWKAFTGILLILLLMVSGCKPRDSKKRISKGKMEAILYDYHIADAVSSTDIDYKDTLRMRIYKQAVLDKYGVSQADFDSSMVYYTRHADQLYEIYERLSKRLADEAIALGSSASEAKQYLSISNTGDTANVWAGDPSFVLSQHPGFNVYSFTLTADSTYKPGDRFVLSFETKFIYQDGRRDGMALLAITFANDSVASSMTRMFVDNQYRVDISDADKLGIKQISGYFILHRNDERDSQTTLKLMHVSNIAIVKMHAKEQEETQMQDLPEKPLRATEEQLEQDEPMEPDQRDMPSELIIEN